MMTKFYRFPDKQTALSALGVEEIFSDQTDPYVAFDVVGNNGVISLRTGGTEEEPQFTTLTGFHLNTNGSVLPELAEFEVFPTNPICVFAGYSE